jgi:hypothetical protein
MFELSSIAFPAKSREFSMYTAGLLTSNPDLRRPTKSNQVLIDERTPRIFGEIGRLSSLQVNLPEKFAI